MKNITICIVDDNNDIRLALEQIITMSDGYDLLGGFSSAEEALQNIPALRPNIVLMDINLGEGESGIDCVRHLKADYPEILFMMCTVYEDDEKIFEALTAGASGSGGPAARGADGTARPSGPGAAAPAGRVETHERHRFRGPARIR